MKSNRSEPENSGNAQPGWRRSKTDLGMLSVVAILLATVLASSIRSNAAFMYWAVPNPAQKHHCLSIGVGHGQLFLAYGWPSSGPSTSLLGDVEPVFGGEQDRMPSESEFPKTERIRMAGEQFDIKIDGVSPPNNYPVKRIPLWAIAVVMVIFAIVFAVRIWREVK